MLGDLVEEVVGFWGVGLAVVEGEEPVALEGEIEVVRAVLVEEVLGVFFIEDDSAVAVLFFVGGDVEGAGLAVEFGDFGLDGEGLGAGGGAGEAEDPSVVAVEEEGNFLGGVAVLYEGVGLFGEGVGDRVLEGVGEVGDLPLGEGDGGGGVGIFEGKDFSGDALKREEEGGEGEKRWCEGRHGDRFGGWFPGREMFLWGAGL